MRRKRREDSRPPAPRPNRKPGVFSVAPTLTFFREFSGAHVVLAF